MRKRAVRASLLAFVLVGVCLAQKESLLIAPGDELHVQVFDTPEMDQTPRVTDAGEIPILFLGNVPVAGMTPAGAARAIEATLIAKKLMLHPQVSVVVEEYATQQVSVMGQVNRPGSFQISTAMPILNILSIAGGVTDIADRHITIERQSDPTKAVSYFLSNHSEEALASQVLIYPGDTVLIPKAGVVYVLGDVGRPGGFPISGNDSQMTVMQALTLAGAPNKSAVLSKAKLVRKTATGTTDVPLALASIEMGKSPDVVLQPDDILFIPFSYMKNALLNGSQIASSAASALIYAHP
jgi:polysaccharide export outer membrane protein